MSHAEKDPIERREPAALPALCPDDLLSWFEENAAELVAESNSIADTGDYSTTWVCYEHHGYPGGKPKRVPIGYGNTPAQAIRDAVLMCDHPNKWTHVPSSNSAQEGDCLAERVERYVASIQREHDRWDAFREQAMACQQLACAARYGDVCDALKTSMDLARKILLPNPSN